MPTIKDIAQAAGVSQGTVSNVLNDRGNVSVEKINLVKKVARELGYQTNEKARLLREGVSRCIVAILPDLKIPCYAQLYSELQEYFTYKGYTLQLYQTQDIPAIEKSVLQNIESTIVDGIITVTCLPHASKYYDTPRMKNIKKIFTLRRPDMNCDYIGFDYFKAGSDIRNYISRKGYETTALFSGVSNYSNEAEFIEGLGNPSSDFHHVEAEYVEINKKAFTFAGLSPQPDCIIATSTAYASALKTALYYSGLTAKPEIITLTPATLQKDSPWTEYQMDFRKLGQELGKYFFSPTNEKTSSTHILKNTGLAKTIPYSTSVPTQETINLLTINSPATLALKKILPLFQKETGIKVNVMSFSYDETFHTIQAFGNSGTYDLFRLDMAWGAWFASEFLTPFEEIPCYSEEIFSHILPELIEDYCKFNNVYCAFPLDPSVQLLFYRKDLFEDAVVKRGYYESYKKDLKVPETFEELNQLARYFSKKYFSESPTDYGITMVAGNAGMASCEMIPRLLADKDLAADSIPLCLNGASGQAALQNYLECSNYCKDPQTSWWSDAVEEFASGSTAMTIIFANHASEIIGSQSTKVAGKLGYAPVPGSKPLLGGGILGISRSSSKKEAAMKFIQWLTRDDIALVFTLLGGVSGNPTVYENPEIIQRYPWMQEVRRNFSFGIGRKNWLSSSKIVEERRVEEILGISIRNALNGNIPSKKALDYAQRSISELL